MDTPTLLPLPTIPYLRLRLTLRAEEPAELPAYQGSMLRGAFGHALRRLVCVAGPRQPCATCRLRHPRHRLPLPLLGHRYGQVAQIQWVPAANPTKPLLDSLRTKSFHSSIHGDPPVEETRIACSRFVYKTGNGEDLRYSNRQERTMNFGGLLGTVELEGDLAPLAPLLRTA